MKKAPFHGVRIPNSLFDRAARLAAAHTKPPARAPSVTDEILLALDEGLRAREAREAHKAQEVDDPPKGG